MALIQVLIEHDEKRKLSEMADAEKRSMSNMTRLLINQAYEKYQQQKQQKQVLCIGNNDMVVVNPAITQ